MAGNGVSKTQQIFRILVLMSSVDGDIKPESMEVLEEFANKLKLGRSEFASVIGAVRKNRNQPLQLPKSEASRKQLFRALVRLVAVDGKVTAKEMRFLSQIAKAIGVSQKRIDAKLKKALKKATIENQGYELLPLDDAEVNEVLYDAPEQVRDIPSEERELEDFYSSNDNLFLKKPEVDLDDLSYAGASLALPGLGHLLKGQLKAGLGWMALFFVLSILPIIYVAATMASIDTPYGKVGGFDMEMKAIKAIYSLGERTRLDNLNPERGQNLRTFAFCHVIGCVMLWLWQAYQAKNA